MTYTEISQLPPPPKWMLDEANAEDLKQSQAMLPSLMTIREFRKVMLPIFYEAKSATGRIMNEALARYYSSPRQYRGAKNLHLRKDLRKTDYAEKGWDIKHFIGSYCEHHDYFMGYIYKSECEKMVMASRKKTIEQLKEFIKTKSGKIYSTRLGKAKTAYMYGRSMTCHEDIITRDGLVYYPKGNLWKRMEELKKRKWKGEPELMKKAEIH